MVSLGSKKKKKKVQWLYLLSSIIILRTDLDIPIIMGT